MNAVEKILQRNLSLFRSSERCFRDFYEVIFDRRKQDCVMCETVTTLRIRKTTYGEVRRRTELLAASISARYGSEGAYIGLRGRNSVEWTVLFWAILRSGNCPYLVNLQQPDGFTASVLRTLGARAMISVDVGEMPAFTADAPCEVALYSELWSASDALLPLSEDAFFGDNVAITTSGTTLSEKICIYSGRRFSEQVLNTEAIVRENPDMLGNPKTGVKHLAFLPFYHIFGLAAVYLWFCFFDAVFVFPKSLAPDALLEAARRCEVTHVFAVPLFWHALEKAVLRAVSELPEAVQEKFRTGLEKSIRIQTRFPRIGRRIVVGRMREIREQLLPDSVRFCISGGSSLRDSAIRLVNALGYSLSNGYGMSEIGITSVELSRSAAERIRSSIGKPFGSVEYRVTEEGHLAVRGSSLCERLIVNGGEQSTDGWFDTGDLVIEENGRYFFSGRSSDLIMGENGENLNPDLISEAFLLNNAAGFAVLGDAAGEKPVLVVRLPEGISDSEWETIECEVERCNAALPLSLQVKGVYYTFDPLMRATDIKVSRKWLRREIDAGRIRFVTRGTDLPLAETVNESSVRETIRALMAEILGTDGASIPGDAHFMNDLGGTSLDYFTLIGDLDRTFDVRVPYESENFGYCLDDFETLIKELRKAHV